MSHFGIMCPPIAGHVNPFCALGRALVARGHRVTVFQVQDLEPTVRMEGLEFFPLGRTSFPPGALGESVTRLASLQGMASIKFAVECGCRIARLLLDEGADAVRAAGIDALLVDQNEPAGGTVAEFLGLPFVSVCTSLPLDREPLIPPPFVGWSYGTSTIARLRNRVSYAVADHFISPLHKTLNEFRSKWKLTPLHSPNDSFSRRAEIAQMPRAFDFPREQAPANFHYFGPWFDELSCRAPFPYERLDGRPLIYASLGTLQKKDHGYFRIIAEACVGLDAQLVLSLGSPNATVALNLPGDHIVVNYAPQLDILARTSLTITHGGMNTTLQSLYFGAPLIAIPLTHDQPAIAARLSRTGAGLVIPPKDLNAKKLRSAIREVIQANNSYRISTLKMMQACRAAGGVDRAAEIVEGAVRVKPFVRAATNVQ